MYRQTAIVIRLLGLAVVVWLVGCGGAAEPAVDPPLLPTLRPTAVVERTQAAAQPTVPAATATPPRPEASPMAEPELPPGTPTPDMSIIAEISLTSVQLEGVSGGDVTLAGRVRLRSDQTIEAAVLAPGGRVLTAVQVAPGDFNTWQAKLTLPLTFAGQAEAQVAVIGPDGEAAALDSRPMVISPNTEQERYLEIYRPALAEPVRAAGGYYLFFDGHAERPVGFRVGIEIFDDDCQRRINRQNYALRGSGYWQAYIVVPEEASGLTCALVSFGEEGTADRREVALRLDVLPRQEREAAMIVIGSPQPGNDLLTPGRMLSLSGTASNAPGDEVQLTLLLADGTIAATASAGVDRYGYWESDLLIPVELAEAAQLTAAIGTQEKTLATVSRLFEVEE